MHYCSVGRGSLLAWTRRQHKMSFSFSFAALCVSTKMGGLTRDGATQHHVKVQFGPRNCLLDPPTFRLEWRQFCNQTIMAAACTSDLLAAAVAASASVGRQKSAGSAGEAKAIAQVTACWTSAGACVAKALESHKVSAMLPVLSVCSWLCVDGCMLHVLLQAISLPRLGVFTFDSSHRPLFLLSPDFRRATSARPTTSASVQAARELRIGCKQETRCTQDGLPSCF